MNDYLFSNTAGGQHQLVKPQKMGHLKQHCDLQLKIQLMSDIDDQEVRDPDADLPKYKVRYTDMTQQQVKLCVRKSTELLAEESKKPETLLEKNVCMKLVDYLKSDKKNFGSGEGEWQCIIGKNLAATLTYELHMLTFFDLPDFGRSVLVFKSG